MGDCDTYTINEDTKWRISGSECAMQFFNIFFPQKKDILKLKSREVSTPLPLKFWKTTPGNILKLYVNWNVFLLNKENYSY